MNATSAVQVSEDGRLVYVSTELSNTLIAVPADPATGSLGEIASVTSLLPEGYDGPPTTASHVELSPCGGFAYVGNRVGVDLDGVSCRRFPSPPTFALLRDPAVYQTPVLSLPF